MGHIEVRLALRLRLLLRLSDGLGRMGLLPTARTIDRLPVAKRKATKPARWMTLPLPADVDITEHMVPGDAAPVPVRIYQPNTVSTGSRPLVEYIHGGGWVTGGLDAAHWVCAQLAAQAGTVVVSVDYRLAPESRYPAALSDCRDVLCWLVEHGSELGGDPARIAVAGDSAGGNLAAALCLLARRDRLRQPLYQVLIYPALDATLSNLRVAGASGAGLTPADVAATVRHYLGDADPRDPMVSPLLADDLATLPPALVLTADHDILRDEGRLYADRLAAAGVPVRATNYLGMPHGFLSMPRLCRAAPQALAEIAQGLTLAFESRQHIP